MQKQKFPHFLEQNDYQAINQKIKKRKKYKNGNPEPKSSVRNEQERKQEKNGFDHRVKVCEKRSDLLSGKRNKVESERKQEKMSTSETGAMKKCQTCRKRHMLLKAR